MIIDILFFHCSFVDILNIISTCRDILCVDINVDKRCVDHITSWGSIHKSDIAIWYQKNSEHTTRYTCMGITSGGGHDA